MLLMLSCYWSYRNTQFEGALYNQMRYTVIPESKEKGYLQLYRQLLGDIREGVYPYGAKLPSKRLLAEEAGVSVITAEHAYALLSEEGYIEAAERSGYYVIYRDSDFLTAPEAEREVPTPVPAPGSVQLPPSAISFSLLARTMRKVLLDRGERILVKSQNHGCPELRGALAGYLARTQGIHVSPEQVVIGSGAEYLYTLIAQLFPGQVFGIEDTSYEKIRRVYETCGIRCDALRMSSDGIASAELARTEATVLHVTPFHSYPSGVTATASKRAEYLRFAERMKGYLIEDNFDSELTVSAKNESTVFSLSESGRVIYMNTFSRTVAPSVRVGYLVLPRGLLARFEQKLGFLSCTVPVFEQYVLAELIASGDFERHINRVRRERRKKE